MKTYNRRTWLNSEMSYASSSVVAFDGEIEYRDNQKHRHTSLTVSDCNISATLNKNHGDSMEDFIAKMKLLRYEIDLFIQHLEQ